jgi:hypothetical protein
MSRLVVSKVRGWVPLLIGVTWAGLCTYRYVTGFFS